MRLGTGQSGATLATCILRDGRPVFRRTCGLGASSPGAVFSEAFENDCPLGTAEQIADVLVRLDVHPLHAIVALTLGSGMRRGELCGLGWGALDLDKAAVRIERRLEETKDGLQFKPPKFVKGLGAN